LHLSAPATIVDEFREEHNTTKLFRGVPGAIQCYALHDSVFPLFMELEAFGTSLATKIKSAGIDTIESFLKLGADICEAVAHIHDKEMRHLDITSSNILYDDATDSVKIIDFGNSRPVCNAAPFIF
jgi:serine/threonine protein kinase